MKRWLHPGLQLAIVSVIANVAIAWGSALQVRLCEAPDVGRYGWRTAESAYAARHLRGLGADQVVAGAVPIVEIDGDKTPAVEPAVPFFDLAPPERAWTSSPPDLPVWCDVEAWRERLDAADLSNSGSGVAGFVIWEARGWPARSMACTLEPEPGTGSWQIVGTSAIPARRWASQCARHVSDQRALPLRPIWSGLIVNCIVYMLIVVLGRAAVRAVARFRRRRRRRCPVCGSPAGDGSTCPECGQMLPGRGE